MKTFKPFKNLTGIALAGTILLLGNWTSAKVAESVVDEDPIFTEAVVDRIRSFSDDVTVVKLLITSEGGKKTAFAIATYASDCKPVSENSCITLEQLRELKRAQDSDRKVEVRHRKLNSDNSVLEIIGVRSISVISKN